MSEELEVECHETSESVDAAHHGKAYEKTMSKFVFKRLLDKNYKDFKFTREKKGLGKFDDLAYVYETEDGQKRYCLMQLKHIDQDSKTISYHDLATDENSYFYLPKYYKHYIDYRKAINEDKDLHSADLESLIICTNIKLESNLGDFQVCSLNNASIFEGSENLKRLKLSDEKKRKIFQESYLDDRKKLANELTRYAMLKKKIDVNSLESDEHVSLILHNHIVLSAHIIDVPDNKQIKPKFNKRFLNATSEVPGVKEFLKILQESFCEFYVEFKDYSVKELRNTFKLNEDNANKLKERILLYESEKIINFLKHLTIDINVQCGEGSLLIESQKDIPGETEESPQSMEKRKQLADGLIKFVMFNELIDAKTLNKYCDVNAIIGYLNALGNHVIDELDKKFKQSFLEGKSKIVEVNKFCRCLLQSFSEFYSKCNCFRDNPCGTFKLDESGVKGLRKKNLKYESTGTENFLQNIEIIITRKTFGKSSIFLDHAKETLEDKEKRNTLAKELSVRLIECALLNSPINIAILKEADHRNLILKEHIALVKYVIDVHERKFKQSFLNSEGPGVQTFLECLGDALKEFHSKYKGYNDDELRNEFNLDELDVSALDEKLSKYESEKVQFLKDLEFNIAPGFGDSFLPVDTKESADITDKSIDEFLLKLVFVQNQNRINNEFAIDNEMESKTAIAFNKKIDNWFYHGSFIDEKDNKRKRGWIRKQNIVKEAMMSNVLFQGKKIKINQLFTKENILTADILMRVFCGLDIAIGCKLRELGVIQHYYINRVLLYEGRPVSEKDLYSHDGNAKRSSVIIAAGPGMGKSTLVTSIAQRVMDSSHIKGKPDWVVSILLRNAVERLQKVNCFQSLEEVVSFISDVSNTSNESEKQLLREFLEHENRFVLLLDGFDELYESKCKQKIIQLLDILISKNCVKILLITTRLQNKEQLEKCLRVSSYSFEKLSEDEQISFLTRYWVNVANVVEEKAEQFSRTLVGKMPNILNDKDRSFLGIPLHIYMLAVIFQGETDTEVIPESMNLLSFFYRFVRKKYEIYLEEKCGDSLQKYPERYKVEMRNYDILHQNQAIICFMSPEYVSLFVSKEKINFELLLDIGLVEKSQNNIEFIHMTFAEYFVAMKFADVALLAKKDNAQPKAQRSGIGIEDILFVFSYEFIFYLFDLKIAENFKFGDIIIQGDIASVKKLTNEQINETDPIGRSLLFYGGKYAHDALENLIDKGIFVDFSSPFLRWYDFKDFIHRKDKIGRYIIENNVSEIPFRYIKIFDIKEEIDTGKWKIVKTILKNGLFLTDCSMSLYKYAKKNVKSSEINIPSNPLFGEDKVILDYTEIICHLLTRESNLVTKFLNAHCRDFINLITKTKDQEFHDAIFDPLKISSLFANLSSERKKPLIFFENCCKTLVVIVKFQMESRARCFFEMQDVFGFLTTRGGTAFLYEKAKTFLLDAGFLDLKTAFRDIEISILEKKTKIIYADIEAATKRYQVADIEKGISLINVVVALLGAIYYKNMQETETVIKLHFEVCNVIEKKDFVRVKKILRAIEDRGWLKAVLNASRANECYARLESEAEGAGSQEIMEYIALLSSKLEEEEILKEVEKKHPVKILFYLLFGILYICYLMYTLKYKEIKE